MHWLLLILFVLAVVFGPSLWAKAVLAHHADDRPDYPGTGGELARHLLDEAGLKEVALERADQGDHYDPAAKAVRLTPDNLNGRSLTAVAVAAHEVGHALQDRDGYGPLKTRTRLVKSIGWLQRVGSIIIFSQPSASAPRPRPLDWQRLGSAPASPPWPAPLSFIWSPCRSNSTPRSTAPCRSSIAVDTSRVAIYRRRAEF
jgi:hypothetical protein